MIDLSAYLDRWILLTWHDATDAPNEWTSKDTFIVGSTLTRVTSAGMLVHVDDQRVVLASSRNDGDEYGSGIAVPRSWVLEVVPLKEGKVVATGGSDA